MYPESIRNAPKLHQDSRGAPVTPGDWLVDSLDASLPPVQVVRLHGAGQFVYLSETGAELTSFCCCFTICSPPAQERLGKSLAAPAAAGQGVCTSLHQFHDRDDGLLHCMVCSGAEGSLPIECPGRRMTDSEQDAVYAGQLDFLNGAWDRRA